MTDLFADASWYVAGTKVFLGDTQAHYAIAGELVEDDMGWSGGRGAHNLTTDDDD